MLTVASKSIFLKISTQEPVVVEQDVSTAAPDEAAAVAHIDADYRGEVSLGRVI